jgi:hypothetical protein
LTVEGLENAYSDLVSDQKMEIIKNLPLLTIMLLISVTKLMKVGYKEMNFLTAHDIYTTYCKKAMNMGRGIFQFSFRNAFIL